MNEITTFDGHEIQRGETLPAAMAARETAEAQARYVMAVKRPRNVEAFRVKLLQECKRLTFAESAEYYKPVGKKKNEATGDWEQQYATGPSIRLVEVAAQFFGNLDIRAQILYETEEHRVIECCATDIENNTRWSENRTIPRTMEKRGERIRGSKEIGPPSGRDIIAERKNTYGETVYICRATAEEVQMKQAAESSKSLRNQVNRLLPRDIIEEAIAACRETVKKQIADDPKASVRRLLSAFADLGVSVDDIEIWASRKTDQLSPKDIQQLRQMWTALREKETTWQEIMAAKDPQGSTEAAAAAAAQKLAEMQKNQPAPTKDLAAETAEFDRQQAAEQAGEGKKKGKLAL